jgi:hypothetical protein
MRIAALIFALLGIAGSGFIGAKWYRDLDAQKVQLALAKQLIEASGDPAAKAKLAELNKLEYATYAFLASTVLAVLGCVLLVKRKGALAAAVFLVAFVTPVAILADWKPIIFTFGLALATLFAFFVKPAPEVVVKKRYDHIEADTDMV